MLTEDNVRVIIVELQRVCSPEIYPLILSDLILKNSIASKRQKAINGSTHEALTAFLSDKVNKQPFKEILFKVLHQSWCQIYKNLPSAPSADRFNLPAILAWGYELKIKKTKTAILYDFYLNKLDSDAQVAFWEAIRISEVHSIYGLHVNEQADTDWIKSYKGLTTSPLLTTLHFRYNAYQFSDVSWQLFWDTIHNSSIKHLDLKGSNLSNKKLNILFQKLSNSDLDFLSLEAMYLFNLMTEQWKSLYQAIETSKLSGLNLSSNSLNDSISSHGNNNPASWEIICQIIKLPTLKHLVLRGQDCKDISDNGWCLFCNALSESQLENLDCSIDYYHQGANDMRWAMLLDALKKAPVKKLTISTRSAESFSSVVLTHFCDMLKQSNIDEVTLYTGQKALVFSADEWKLLGSALSKRNIKNFNFGAVELSDLSNLKNFGEGLRVSGIQRLCLERDHNRDIPAECWEQLATLIKESEIQSLNLLGVLSLSSYFWPNFCDFIKKSSIKELTFSLGAYKSMELEQVKLLGQAIQSSQLESLNLKGMLGTINHMPLANFKLLCEAIKSKECKIISLTNVYMSELLSEAKQNLLAETLEVVNVRAQRAICMENLSKKSLEALCARTLFNSNAHLTPTGVAFEINKLPHTVDLPEGAIDILKKYFI